jgi:hypothetical protein
MNDTTVISVVIVSVVVVVCCCLVQINRRWRQSDIYAQLYRNHQPTESEKEKDSLDEISPAPVHDPNSASPFWGMDSSGRVGHTREVIQGQTFTPPISSYPETPVFDPPVLILDQSDRKEDAID